MKPLKRSKILLVEHFLHRLIPGQFGIAFIITVGAMTAAFFKNGPNLNGLFATLEQWQRGFWDGPLMIFTLQMLLILVFGYSIAISPKVCVFLKVMAEWPASGRTAALLASAISILTSWLNWGLGLVAGAVYVRLLGHSLQRRKIPFNYPLLGAAGYSGMMIWHGGLSGSAPLKAAESGHLRTLVSSELQIPDAIDVGATLFSGVNIFITFTCAVAVIATVFLIHSRSSTFSYPDEIPAITPEAGPRADLASGAEILEFKRWPAYLISILIFGFLINKVLQEKNLGFFTPNIVISILLAAGLWLHGSLRAYMLSIDRAIQSASGVVLLFPFYFGIIGLLRYSGVSSDITGWFVTMADQSSFPIVVFISSAVLNLLIPSGGGQWAVQGPIILESGIRLGIPLENVLLSFAYGDQLTNMLQPFWAIPLLYITRIRASELIGYTFFIFLTGFLIFGLGIFLFF